MIHLGGEKIYQIYQLQTTLQATLQRNGNSVQLEHSFSSKATTEGPDFQSQIVCLLTSKRDGLIDKPHP